MQLYKVKLLAPSAYPKDNVNGYLGNIMDSGEIALYTRGEAIKKARMFDGKIEPHGKNYVVNTVKICQLFAPQIHPTILKELEGRHTFTDTESIDDNIYTADVFDAILGEQFELTEVLMFSDEVLDELRVLSELTSQFEYVLLVRPLS
jgi:hypothetical protein